MTSTNEELGIFRVDIAHLETIHSLVVSGEVDVSSLDKRAKAYLSRIGNKTGGFEFVRVSLLKNKDKELSILSRSRDYFKIKISNKLTMGAGKSDNPAF